jgi:hypothetical protein
MENFSFGHQIFLEYIKKISDPQVWLSSYFLYPTFNNPSSSLQHGIWMENKMKQKILILLGATGIELLFRLRCTKARIIHHQL